MGAVTSKKKEYKIDKNDDEVDEYVEAVVCRKDELEDGQMKECALGEGKVLVLKQNGKFIALGSKCTHYGAPLAKGVLINGRIRCPWHGACFNATTGDIEDFPGLDSLPCFEVSVNNEEVKVKALTSVLQSHKRVKSLTKHIPANPQTFVIVGGGPASQSCIETLRQNGFDGKLILITKEKHYPYDRPKLSKALNATPEELYFRTPEFYRQADVTVMLETEVTGIDTEQHWVQCDNGKLMVKYDSVMIASGSAPMELTTPGSSLKNVCYLRTPEDANHIAANSVGKAVIIVGTSFIGMEVASYLMNKSRSINMITRGDVPFKPIFGEAVGKRMKKMLEERGIVFHSHSSITKFIGSKNILTSVELNSGTILQADICIIGAGVMPCTGFLQSSNITLNPKGLVCVDEYLETSVPDVFACGDIVEFPLLVFNRKKANICHLQMAQAHGHAAALNMLGRKQELRSVPFFWTAICGKNFRFAGYNEGFDDIIVDGSVEALDFIAYYCKDEKVIAVCTLNRDPAAAEFASRIHSGETVLKSEIKKN